MRVTVNHKQWNFLRPRTWIGEVEKLRTCAGLTMADIWDTRAGNLCRREHHYPALLGDWPNFFLRCESYRRLAVTWPCISAPVAEAVAESQGANFVSLPARGFWWLWDALSLCLREGTLPPTALGHQQAVTRIAEKCFVFPRGCYLNKFKKLTWPHFVRKSSPFFFLVFSPRVKERRAKNTAVVVFCFPWKLKCNCNSELKAEEKEKII